jgi:hypothetical protein
MSHSNSEISVPLCIASENTLRDELLEKKFFENQNDISITTRSNDYEIQICHLINKYMPIDCNDDVLFVRPKSDREGNHLLEVIKEKFGLLKQIELCEVFLESGLLEFHSEKKNKKYDKIIIKNCINFFHKSVKICLETLEGFLLPFKEEEDTNILFIQRFQQFNSLPFYKQISIEWSSNDFDYLQFIQSMQNQFYSIIFDIELVKRIIDSKLSWYYQIKDNAVWPLNERAPVIKNKFVSGKELLNGIRELNEGLFKYFPFDEQLELTDQMLFIGAFRQVSIINGAIESIKSDKGKILNEKELNKLIHALKMEITPNINKTYRFHQRNLK